MPSAVVPCALVSLFSRRQHRLDVEQAQARRPRRPVPRRRPDRHRCARASGSRRTARAPCRRGARCAAMSMSKPVSRSASSSAIVVFEPGRMTRSASPGSAVPGCTRTRSTSGSASQRIEIVEIGDVRQDRHGDLELGAFAAAPPDGRAPAHPRPAGAARRKNTARSPAPASRSPARSPPCRRRTGSDRRETC